jgi:hypothetical protein
MASSRRAADVEREVLEHLESWLGPMAGAERAFAEEAEREFKIARFDGQPVRAAETHVTLGVSEVPLVAPDPARVRQELLFTCYKRHSASPQDLLHVVAGDVMRDGRALLRGQVLGPAGPLFPGSRLEALYCGVPVYFDDGFHELHSTEPPTVLMWLIPVARTEAKFVATEGWRRFEDALVEIDPDLLDLEREAVV